jgi:arginyl-tRNA--protein-N-Asp/Glu arginylyltransferase
MAYLNWDTKIISDFSPENVAGMYDAGYVFTRVDKGVMNKTRSFRVHLADFEMTSENRRILRKGEHLSLAVHPLPYAGYEWRIGKLAKDFYDAHDAVFTANKVKELLTDSTKSNFNTLLVYTDTRTNTVVGYAICYMDAHTFHYSFPFYKIDAAEPSRGLSMMIKALDYAKSGADSGKGVEYAYLGSLQRPSDSYKLQFKGGEWFTGEKWTKEIEGLKKILK